MEVKNTLVYEKEGVVKVPIHENDNTDTLTVTIGTDKPDIMPKIKQVSTDEPNLSLYRLSRENMYYFDMCASEKCKIRMWTRRLTDNGETDVPVVDLLGRLKEDKVYSLKVSNAQDDIVAIFLRAEWPKPEPEEPEEPEEPPVTDPDTPTTPDDSTEPDNAEASDEWATSIKSYESPSDLPEDLNKPGPEIPIEPLHPEIESHTYMFVLQDVVVEDWEPKLLFDVFNEVIPEGEEEPPQLVAIPIMAGNVEPDKFWYELPLESGYIFHITNPEPSVPKFVKIFINSEQVVPDPDHEGRTLIEKKWTEYKQFILANETLYDGNVLANEIDVIINRNTLINEVDARAVMFEVYEFDGEWPDIELPPEESPEEPPDEPAPDNPEPEEPEEGEEPGEGEDTEEPTDPDNSDEPAAEEPDIPEHWTHSPLWFGPCDVWKEEYGTEKPDSFIYTALLEYLKDWFSETNEAIEQPAKPVRTYIFNFEGKASVSEEDVEEEDVEEDIKYVLTCFTKEYEGHTLTRIVAVKDFGNIHTGEMGGWVESYQNLSQKGTCWVYNEAIVMEDAWVCDDAQIRGEAIVRDNALINDRAKVMDQALICDDVVICGEAMVRDWAAVCGTAYVNEQAKVLGSALVRDASLGGHCCIQDFATVLKGCIQGNAYITGYAVIEHDVELGGFSRLGNHSKVSGNDDESGTINVQLMTLFTNNLNSTEAIAYSGNDCTWDAEERVYKTVAYAGIPLYIKPIALDPRAKIAIEYVGYDISDDPYMTWSEEMIGRIDDLTIIVTNEHFPNQRGYYQLQVDIQEPPKEEPDEPVVVGPEEPEEPDTPEIDPLGIRSVTTEPPFEIVRTDDTFDISIPEDTQVTFTIEPEDETSTCALLFCGLDISDEPTVYFESFLVGGTEVFEIVVTSTGQSPASRSYPLNVHVVKTEE